MFCSKSNLRYLTTRMSSVQLYQDFWWNFHQSSIPCNSFNIIRHGYPISYKLFLSSLPSYCSLKFLENTVTSKISKPKFSSSFIKYSVKSKYNAKNMIANVHEYNWTLPCSLTNEVPENIYNNWVSARLSEFP